METDYLPIRKEVVMELRDALAEIVNAAFGGNGWDDVDPLFPRQKDALASFDNELKKICSKGVKNESNNS